MPLEEEEEYIENIIAYYGIILLYPEIYKFRLYSTKHHRRSIFVGI